MDNKRLLELAGLDEMEKAFVVIVKHKGQPAVNITPSTGVSKERAMEVKNLLMDMKKDGMKGGKSSDYAEITVKPVGVVNESAEVQQLNEDFEFWDLLKGNELVDARDFAKEAGWSKEQTKDALYSWLMKGDD